VTLYAVIGDYGLNGAGLIGVYSTREAAETVARIGNVTDVSCTGFGGMKVVEVELDAPPDLYPAGEWAVDALKPEDRVTYVQWRQARQAVQHAEGLAEHVDG
jgi:hypothetical protein